MENNINVSGAYTSEAYISGSVAVNNPFGIATTNPICIGILSSGGEVNNIILSLYGAVIVGNSAKFGWAEQRKE